MSFLSVVLCVAAVLELGAPFRDHMVLQRDTPVRVWGWAKSSETVDVRFGGKEVRTTAGADGAWRAELPSFAASKEPRELTVEGRVSGRAVVSDVLVGEVWIASGQSNMEFPLCGENPRGCDREGMLTAQSCVRPHIRFAKMPGGSAAEPQERADVTWRECRPENLCKSGKSVSAVAFYYALELNRKLDVPVGILQAAVGWTPIGAWTPREGNLSVPSLRTVADWRYVADWSKTNVVLEGVVAPIEASNHQPSVLWNRQVAPLAPLSVRGVIWYQGCNDVKWADRYCEKLHALYNGWSQKFENPGLKMYLVQLAPYGGGSMFAHLQIAQDKFASEEPNAAIAHINDLGLVNEIHPNDKALVAKRLAALAFKRDYGFSDIVADPPSLRSVRAEGDTLALTFASAKSLYVLNRDRSLRADFEVAGADGVFRPAEIVNFRTEKSRKGLIASPDTILVRSKDVSGPRQVRYLMRDAWMGSVYNEAGLPLGPFEAQVP